MVSLGVEKNSQNCGLIFGPMHCCYRGLQNVLSFFACMFRSIALDEGYHIENNFWALKCVEKSLQSLGFEPMTLGLQ